MTREVAEKRLKVIHETIESLQNEAKELKSFLAKAIKTENTKNYLNSIHRMSEENALITHLRENTKTTPLMDEFYYSDKEFLVFKDHFLVSASTKDCWRMSLVVAKQPSNISVKNDGLTMTDLKKAYYSWISHDDYSESNRFDSLTEELLHVAESTPDSKTIVAFENPVRLGGQTYANQTGFGSEYNGDDLVYEGTKYGDTTSFCIIGVIVD